MVIPVYYRRSGGTVMVLAPMSALDALRPLGPWLAWRQDNVAILFQGRSNWDLLPWNFKAPHRPAALLADENRCWQCLVSDECNQAGGPDARVPDLVKIGAKHSFEKMEDSIEVGFRRNCISNPHTNDLDVPPRKSITKELEAAGFRLVRTISAFAEHGMEPYAKAPAPPSLKADRWRERRRQSNMTFDDAQVLRNLAEFKEKGENAQREKTRLKIFRENECKKCVYECARPPWSWEAKDFISPCHLAEGGVDTGYTGTDEQKLWLAAHRLSGYDLRMKTDRSGGRLVAGVGAWPDNDNPRLMVIRRRTTGAAFLAKIPIEEYMKLASKDFTSLDEIVAEHVDDERAPLTYWALKRIHEHCRGHARFWNGERFVYNDTYYVEMRDCRYIVIGSDSRASHHGGWGRGGRTITVDERPRFRTHYEYPFFKNIQTNLGITPGARRR